MSKLETEEVNVFDALASLYGAIRSNIVIAIILPLLGMAGAALYYNIKKLRFESELVLATPLLSPEEAKVVAKQLESAASLDSSYSQQVAFVSSTVVPNEYTGDKEQMLALDKVPQRGNHGVLLKLKVAVFDRNVFPKVEQAIISTLNDNPLVVQRRNEQSTYYLRVSESIDKELAGLAQLSLKADAKVSEDPSNIFLAIIALKREKARMDMQLENIKNIQVVKSFGKKVSPKGASLIVYSFAGFVAGALLFFCYLLGRQTLVHYRRSSAI